MACKTVANRAILANHGPSRSRTSLHSWYFKREGPCVDATLPIESEITLSDQVRGTEWEFRIIAVNKAGEGLPSNTVMAVL